MNIPFKSCELDEDHSLWTLKGEKTTIFSSIAAAVAIGDAGESGDFALPAAVVLGYRERDKAVIQLGEIQKDRLERVAADLVDAKDFFRFAEIYLDPAEQAARKTLLLFDGLCEYLWNGYDREGRIHYISPQSTWRYFVSYDHEAFISPVAPEILEDREASVQRCAWEVGQHRIISTPHCKLTQMAMRHKFKEGRKHPLLLALTYGALMLMREQEEFAQQVPKQDAAAAPYGNRW